MSDSDGTATGPCTPVVRPADPDYEFPGDMVRMVHGGWLYVHPEKDCRGENCAIHRPSDHPLSGAPLNWRGDRSLMERVCEHGTGHPDPDDLAFKRAKAETEAGPRRLTGSQEDELRAAGIHGCCGCCFRREVSAMDPEKVPGGDAKDEVVWEMDDNIR